MSRWQIFCAVALRRLPILMPQREAIELKVQQIFAAYEGARSRYSDHDMQLKEVIGDSEIIKKETAQDRLDKWMKMKAEFKFAPHNERLTKTHYIFVKTKFGTDIKDQWLLPQTKFDRELGDQDLFDTARRALKENLNIINGFTIVSRIPSSYYSFKYPRKVVDSVGHDGAKVFYLKANLDRPVLDTVCPETQKWLTRDEARPIVGRNYFRALEKGLLHEGGEGHFVRE